MHAREAAIKTLGTKRKTLQKRAEQTEPKEPRRRAPGGAWAGQGREVTGEESAWTAGVTERGNAGACVMKVRPARLHVTHHAAQWWGSSGLSNSAFVSLNPQGEGKTSNVVEVQGGRRARQPTSGDGHSRACAPQGTEASE